MSRSHSHRIRVRYSDCDPQGVVFNANYVTYFDIGINELWREAIGPYSELLETGVDMVVAEVTARYRAPARFDDEIDILAAVERLGNTSLTTRMEISREGQLLVEGRLVHVFIDRETHRKTPIPDRIRAALSAPGAEPAASPPTSGVLAGPAAVASPPGRGPAGKGPSAPATDGVAAPPSAR